MTDSESNVVSVGPKPGFYNIIHSNFQNCLKYKLVNGHDESEGIVVAADGDDGNLGWDNKASFHPITQSSSRHQSRTLILMLTLIKQWEFTQLGNGRYHIKNCGINRQVTCPKPVAAGVRVECQSRFEKYQFDVRPVGGGEEYS